MYSNILWEHTTQPYSPSNKIAVLAWVAISHRTRHTFLDLDLQAMCPCAHLIPYLSTLSAFPFLASPVHPMMPHHCRLQRDMWDVHCPLSTLLCWSTQQLCSKNHLITQKKVIPSPPTCFRAASKPNTSSKGGQKRLEPSFPPGRHLLCPSQ